MFILLKGTWNFRFSNILVVFFYCESYLLTGLIIKFGFSDHSDLFLSKYFFESNGSLVVSLSISVHTG